MTTINTVIFIKTVFNQLPRYMSLGYGTLGAGIFLQARSMQTRSFHWTPASLRRGSGVDDCCAPGDVFLQHVAVATFVVFICCVGFCCSVI